MYYLTVKSTFDYSHSITNIKYTKLDKIQG